MIQHLSSADYKRMLWKNGAGYTIELARSEGVALSYLIGVFPWRTSKRLVRFPNLMVCNAI
jgi:environmental stress-induced protein Ves